MKKQHDLLFVVLMLSLSLILSACAGIGTEKDPNAGTAKQLVVAISSEPTSMDGTQAADFNTVRACGSLFNQLIRFKDGNTEIEPDLATSWEISDDGLSYTFHLRQGVKFHDGTEFNADAVEFNYNRQTNQDFEYFNTGIFAYSYFIYHMVASTNVVDNYTFQYILSAPYAPFLNNLAMVEASMVSPTAVKEAGKDFGTKPVGTGPFKFVSWTPGTEIVLEKNPDYYEGKAKLDRIIIRPITNSNVRLNELKAGTVNLTLDLLPDSLESLRTDKNLQVVEQPSLHTWFLSMNSAEEPFNDVRVRQAMYYAIDRQSIVDNILLNTGVLANNLTPPGIQGYNEDVPTYEYNPDKAKELLTKAGYADGFSIDFYIPDSGSGMQQPDAMAVAIQSDLSKVGITLNIQKMEWGAYLSQVYLPEEKQGMKLLEMSYITDNADPDNFLYVLASGDQFPPNGYNCSFWSNDEFDTLIKQAQVITDINQRIDLYKQAQVILMTEVPYLVIDHENQIIVMDKDITGFNIHPMGFFNFLHTDITK
jgi:peptide/nickel transport system substrate-binding protein